MTTLDKIYDAVDDFGLITSAEARELGMRDVELVQQARRGKLVRVARGVYRMPVWPYQEAAPYAIAVKAAGPDARLCGESVVALLKLGPTNPSRMYISSPHRVRKSIGNGVSISRCNAEDSVTYYEGIPSQPVREAIKEASRTLGPVRAVEATREAMRQGHLTKAEAHSLIQELEQ